MSKLPSDHQVRERALDPTKSFLCEAPAGSGKTELLTQRFLTLLARVNKPEQIVAITFTRKAVGEMRERVIGAIMLGRRPEPQESHKQKTWALAREVLRVDAEKNWSLLNSPQRLQIKTFDSLCGSLANALPMASSFGVTPQVHDDPLYLYRKAVHQLLGALEEDLPWSDALAVLLTQMDNKVNRVEHLLAQLLGRREDWLPLITQQRQQPDVRAILEASLCTIIAEGIATVAAKISTELQSQWLQLAGFAASQLQSEGLDSTTLSCLNIEMNSDSLPDDSIEGLNQWQGLLAILFTNADSWRVKVDKRVGFPVGSNKEEKAAFKAKKEQLTELIVALKSIPQLEDALLNLRQLPAPRYTDEQWLLLDAVVQLLPVLAAHLNLVFAEVNGVDFTEISLRARTALGVEGAPTALALKLDYQIQHLLVDEFQDTSSSQVELVDLLTSGWMPDDGRTLFCVGDAMQSIYGFRGANVGLFLHCKQHGLAHVNLEPISLNTNFRSEQGVVEWVNQVFSKSFPDYCDISTGAVEYANSIAFDEQANEAAVECVGFDAELPTSAEAQEVVRLVQEYRAENDKGRIAILVRSRGHVAQILPLLLEAGFRYQAVDLEPLKDRPVIQDLLALTRALLHPADRIAWLAVLRAPWCGLLLDDLELLSVQGNEQAPWPLTLLQQIECLLQPRILAKDDQQDLFSETTKNHPNDDLSSFGVSADALLRLQRVGPVFQAAYESQQRKSFRDWIEGTWYALGGPACLSNGADLDNAERFFQLLEKMGAETGVLSTEMLNDEVEKLYAAPDPAADDRLQVMTVHKSKGLEFDRVIMPGLHRGARSNDPELFLWHEHLGHDGRQHLLMAPLTAEGNDKHATYRFLELQEKKKLTYEICRLLYVGCTRAKEKLYLMAAIKRDEKGEFKDPPKNSLLAPIWPHVKYKFRFPLEDVSAEDLGSSNTVASLDSESGADGWQSIAISRLVSEWQMPILEEGHILDAYVPPYRFGQQQINAMTLQVDYSRQLGNVIHQILQAIAQQGLSQWQAKSHEETELVFRHLLRCQGVAGSNIDQLIDYIQKVLANVFADARACYFLSTEFSFSASEWPITYCDGKLTENLVIDRIVEDEQGVWVLDYKTSSPQVNQSLEEFLALEKKTYEQKMKRYISAVMSMGYRDVKALLYFPVVQAWVDVD